MKYMFIFIIVVTWVICILDYSGDWLLVCDKLVGDHCVEWQDKKEWVWIWESDWIRDTYNLN